MAKSRKSSTTIAEEGFDNIEGVQVATPQEVTPGKIIGKLLEALGGLQRDAIREKLSDSVVEGMVITTHHPSANGSTQWQGTEWVITEHEDMRLVGQKGTLEEYYDKTGVGVLHIDPVTPQAKNPLAPMLGMKAMKVEPDAMYKVLEVNVQVESRGKNKERNVEPLDRNLQYRSLVLTPYGMMWSGYACDDETRSKVKQGSHVFLNNERKIIALNDNTELPTISEMRMTVQRIIDPLHIEVDAQKVVRLRPEMVGAIEVGDDVTVDLSGSIVLRKVDDKPKLAKPKSTKTRVEWDDVVGLEEAKQRIVENIINPMKHASLYEDYGMRSVPKGMMLYGPPGCGKTLLGRAIATAIADAAGVQPDEAGFIYVKSTELLDSYVGESEKKVRSLFARANKHYENSGWPAVIFIDEADAVLSARGRDQLAKNLVAPFLTEMDGFDEQKAFVILATNRHDVLDPAITRNSRIDFKVCVTRPSRETAEGIIQHGLAKSRCADPLDVLAQKAIELFWSSDRIVKRLATPKYGNIVVRLRDCINGAMAQSVVNEAVTSSIRRDLAQMKEEGRRKPYASGVTVGDIEAAVESVYEQARHLQHDDVLYEVAERMQEGAQVNGVSYDV
jgi:proteasome-associated ATPase